MHLYGKLSRGKLSPVSLPPPDPNCNLNRKPNAGGFVRGGGQSSEGRFYGHELNSTFQKKINATSSVEQIVTFKRAGLQWFSSNKHTSIFVESITDRLRLL